MGGKGSEGKNRATTTNAAIGTGVAFSCHSTKQKVYISRAPVRLMETNPSLGARRPPSDPTGQNHSHDIKNTEIGGKNDEVFFIIVSTRKRTFCRRGGEEGIQPRKRLPLVVDDSVQAMSDTEHSAVPEFFPHGGLRICYQAEKSMREFRSIRPPEGRETRRQHNPN